MPRWFNLEAGLSRSQVSVEKSYYISPLHGGTAAFVLRRQDGAELSRVSGKVRGGHPIYFGPATTDPLHQYLSYVVVTINGLSEAIEHRGMEPVFYISDDPAVLDQILPASTQ